ncbi:MAG: SCO family protein [Leptospiraceae bacterium]|nr:SCO family protein [Leptospiraceae bacterium]MBK7053912.1 SCO family protein [Leptospiraceae bacterium]MBK9499965.1 SCO family protein [Leptospiraceae bacterium]MBL0263564.1 SCO family protein [Leptospiraceae bacterium]MBP9162989.1 SCO family protein [Leptospiraceae bacterium]
MKFISFQFLLLVLSLCANLGYGFVTNKQIGNLELATETGSQYLHNYQADGYIFFFGYSRCNTTCPMGLQTFHKLYANPKFPKGVIPFFISIDLARDNWENLNRLSKNYNDRIVFILPHSEEELRQLTKEFEVQFSKTNALDSNYEINHTGNIFFVDSKFKLVRIFTSNHRDATKIANEIYSYYQTARVN